MARSRPGSQSFSAFPGPAARVWRAANPADEDWVRAVCFEAALRVYTERDFPHDWATTQNNLGIAYSDLPTGDRGENLRRAIACFEAAFRGYTFAGMASAAKQALERMAALKHQAD